MMTSQRPPTGPNSRPQETAALTSERRLRSCRGDDGQNLHRCDLATNRGRGQVPTQDVVDNLAIVALYVVVVRWRAGWGGSRALPLLWFDRRRSGRRLAGVPGRDDDPPPSFVRGVRPALHDLRTGRGSAPAGPQA